MITGCAGSPKTQVATTIHLVSRHYEFSTTDARAFADTAGDLLSDSAAIRPVEIQKVSKLFAALPRHQISKTDLFELKYLYEHWRHAVQAALLENARHPHDLSDLERIIASLSSLDLTIDLDDLKSIGVALATYKTGESFQKTIHDYANLIALQGDARISAKIHAKIDLPFQTLELYRLKDGPDKWLKIPPSYKSSWPFEKWQQFTEFTQYFRDDDGDVIFRGIEFQIGDALIVNLQNPSEGLFSVALEGRKYAPHMAVYVEVRTENGIFPAVYEIHQYGPRLVPLHIFLSDAMVAYVEVYRHVKGPLRATENLGDAARMIAAEERGFNLVDGSDYDPGDGYLNCVTACQMLFERSGYPLEYPEKSRISPKTQAALKFLGFNANSFLAPTDILRWSDLMLVGIVDNGFYIDNIARSLINVRMHDRLANEALILNGPDYALFRWASGLVLADTPIFAPMLRAAFGFTKDNFPNGSKEMLAFMELLPSDVDRAVSKLVPPMASYLATYTEKPNFSMHGIMRDPRVQQYIDRAMVPADRWFTPQNQAD